MNMLGPMEQQEGSNVFGAIANRPKDGFHVARANGRRRPPTDTSTTKDRTSKWQDPWFHSLMTSH